MKAKSSSPPLTLIEALAASFGAALRVPDGWAEPVALLWTDADGQWQSLMPKLRPALPALYCLGPFNRADRTGPVIWLKCVVDGSLPEDAPPNGATPILYLPHVSRQELRASGECRPELQPLIELQYRGKVWHQPNGRDWSVEAFLGSADGLGLGIAQDNATREAMLRVLPLLAETPLGGLRGRGLEADDFDKLAVADPIRDLLRWMSNPDAFQRSSDPGNWQSFRNICRTEFNFDPEDDGATAAAKLLIEGGGRWDGVWARFCEAPKLYAGLSRLLREPGAGQGLLTFEPSRRPRENDEAEARLGRELKEIVDMPHAQACAQTLALEKEHGPRRQWVWAGLGESPYAIALEPLSRLAELAKSPLGGASVAAIAESYANGGWRCDGAVLEALASVKGTKEASVIAAVVRALYGPWLDASARHFQEVLSKEMAVRPFELPGMVAEQETCVVFADGLRFDLAGGLQAKLEGRSLRVRLQHRLVPLPTVTATAKPIVTPAWDQVGNNGSGEDFMPLMKGANHPATTARLREEMERRGIQALSAGEVGSPGTSTHGAWTETARIDELGHKLGAELAAHVDLQLEKIADRVFELLESGWRRVRVVTDHGWLLMPGGLPKVELPGYLVSTKWARCAVLTSQSAGSMPDYLWYWNPQIRIACPPGMGSFVAGSEYAHGGVSVQECVVPELLAERGEAGITAVIQTVQWRGMRCRVSVETNDPAVRVDLRLNWKDASSSITEGGKAVGLAGEVSLVSDDEYENHAATLVLVDPSGHVLDRRTTTVGESK